jgi:neutral ceramidase
VEALRAAHGAMFDLYMGDATPELAAPLSVVVLNGSLAFAGMPGEIFVQYQIALKDGSPLRDSFLCGYANGYYAYFPTLRDAVAGGYGGTMASFVGLGAGDRLLLEAQIEIARLCGKARQTCSGEDFVLLE